MADTTAPPITLAQAQAALNVCQLFMSQNQNWTVGPNGAGQLVWGTSSGPAGPSIATIPTPPLQQAAYSLDLAQYITGPYQNPTLVTDSGSITGWSLGGSDGVTLIYTPGGPAQSGVAQLSVQPLGGGTPVLSNNLTLASSIPIGPDVTPPTVPLELAVSLNATFQPVLVWSPSTDQAPPNAQPSGLKGYPLSKGGSVFTTKAAPDAGFLFQSTNQDIGSPAIAGSTVQTGGVFVMTGNGADYYNAADSGQFAYVQVTGGFTFTARLTAGTWPATYSKFGIDARLNLTAGSPHVAAVISTPGATAGVSMNARTLAGGATTTPGSATVAFTLPFYVRLVFNPTGNVFSMYYSQTGLAGSFILVATFSIALASQIYLGLMCAALQAGSTANCTFDQVNCSQDAQVSYTDTNTSQGATAQTIIYAAASEDNALNVSANGGSVSIVIPATGGGGGGGGAGLTVSAGQWLYNGVPFSPVGFSMNSMQETQGQGSRWGGMQQTVQSYQAMMANCQNSVSAAGKKYATINSARIMFSGAAWMGYVGVLPTAASSGSFTQVGSSGTYYAGGQGGPGTTAGAAAAALAYQNQIKSMIANLVQSGCNMVVLDNSWPTPVRDSDGAFILPIGQAAMMSAADAAMWADVSKKLGRGSGFAYAGNIAYELYNEPFYDNSYGDSTNLATGVKDLASGAGTFTNYQMQDNFNCLGQGVNHQFNVAGGVAVRWTGYNAQIAAIRANGDTNVCLVGCPWFSGEIEFFQNMPIVDSANQYALSYHPYSTNSGQRPNGQSILTTIQKAGIAVCATELGVLSNVQTTYVAEYAAGRGYIWCSYNNWNSNPPATVATHMASVPAWNSQQIAPAPTGSN